MKFVRNLLDRFNGMHYRQEYLCLVLEEFIPSLHLYLVIEGKPSIDLTAHHSFVGYCPVIFALPGKHVTNDRIHLVFSANKLTLNVVIQKKDVLAELIMGKIHLEGNEYG